MGPVPASDRNTGRIGGLDSVIRGGYCIGCGACAAMDARIRLESDEMGRLVAVLPTGESPGVEAERSCPFSDAALDEDALASALYAGGSHARDAQLGFHLASFAGWVEEEGFRSAGSSGGMGAWLLCELLRRDMVDAVVHVAEVPPAGDGTPAAPLFAFTVSTREDDVRAHAKSRYYPVEMSGVIDHILRTPGRYAVVGVPCFCKALRLAARQSPVLAERLTFVVGIVCGHLKSAAFAEALAWQCGIAPSDLTAIDFRVKLEGRPASRYGLRVQGLADGRPVSATRPMEGLVGANWGHGLFKYKACEFCDDVLAETADAVVGDAWLPQYEQDHRGTNVAVVRDARILAIMRDAATEGRLHLEDLPAEAVVRSQAGGFRHRRDGLAFRLWLTDRAREWRPRKRVRPERRHLTRRLQRIHRLRYALGQASHAAFLEARRAGELDGFHARIMPLIRRYDRLQSGSLMRRVAGYIKRSLFSAGRRFGGGA